MGKLLFLALTVVAGIVRLTITTSLVQAEKVNTLTPAEEAYLNGHYKKSFTLVKPEAIRGIAASQTLLGDLYREGVGIKKDPSQALQWYEKAGNQGYLPGAYRASLLHLHGIGTEKDGKAATMWYQKINHMYMSSTTHHMGSELWHQKRAEAGDALHQFIMGKIAYGRDSSWPQTGNAVKWYRMAAAQGLVLAQHNLGIYLFHNRYLNTDADAAEGLRLLEAAAVQGFALAQASLFYAYYSGMMIPKDFDKAILYAKKAAPQGSAESQRFLASAYKCGTGVPQDFRKMHYWLLQAAEMGYTPAQFNVGESFEAGEGVKQNYLKAAEWYQKATERGHAMAATRLGQLYENGLGVDRDLVTALMWYLVSKEGQYIGGTSGKIRLEKKLTPSQIAEAESRLEGFIRLGDGHLALPSPGRVAYHYFISDASPLFCPQK